MSLYVMSDAPIRTVVDLLLQEPYMSSMILFTNNEDAYTIRAADEVLVSLDQGPNDNGDLDTFIIIPEKQEELQRKIFESVKKIRYKATICEPPNDDEVVYMPDNPLPAVPAELD